MTELVLAVDIGGTKIAAALVERSGHLVHHRSTATPGGDAERVWSAVETVVHELLGAGTDGGTQSGSTQSGSTSAGETKVAGVGIACAGPVDPLAGTVSPVNIAGWRQFPLRERMAAAVPGVPVRLAGDGLCMAVGEHHAGAARGARFALGMVVSTGVGGGLVLDGRPYHGRTGNAGHVGHVVVNPNGPPCSCGGRGCVEAFAAGPRMVQWAREQGWVAGADAGARQLAVAAAAGDEIANLALRRGGTALAAAIASVAAVCDLELVVIGGGVAAAGPLLFGPVRAALATHARLGFLRELTVLPAALGGRAGLVGAARLVSTGDSGH